MSSLDALTGTGVYARELGGVAAAPSSFVEATVATTPTAVDEEVMVLVGAEGSQLQAGPCRWEPRVIDGGLLFPVRGDPCLVVTGDKGHRAIVWWRPNVMPDQQFVDLTLGSHFSAVAPSVGPPAGYVRSGLAVEVRGYVTGDASAVGATIATLPVDDRPVFSERFIVQAGPSGALVPAYVRVGADGQIVLTGGPASTFISLSGIRFWTQ